MFGNIVRQTVQKTGVRYMANHPGNLYKSVSTTSELFPLFFIITGAITGATGMAVYKANEALRTQHNVEITTDKDLQNF